MVKFLTKNNSLKESVGNLTNLKSLSVKRNKISHLPHQLRNLKEVTLQLNPGLSPSLQKLIEDVGGVRVLFEKYYRKGKKISRSGDIIDKISTNF